MYNLNLYLSCFFITAMVALFLNKQSPKMVLLTLTLLIDAFIPIPHQNWWINCIGVELIVFMTAHILNTTASSCIKFLSVQMIVLHIIGMNLNGQAAQSPYRCIAALTEYSEILSCVLLSNPIINIIKGKMKCHLLKS